MAVDERGTVGIWKGYQVYVLEKKEYIDNQNNLKDDVVYVIADDGMRMVNRGYTIGYLSRNGSVNECDIVRFKKKGPQLFLLLERKRQFPLN